MNDDDFRTLGPLRFLMLHAMSRYLTATLSFIAITTVFAVAAWCMLRRIRRQFEERVRKAERERIARDIHDTLLQGVQVVLFQLGRWSKDAAISPRQRRGIDFVTMQLRAAVIETRDRIAMLREMEMQRPELIGQLRVFGETESEDTGVRFELRCRGASRTLVPSTHDQLLMIAREAIRNAFKHARASMVCVDVAYESSGLSLDIVDDGRGIDDNIALGEGADGHYGLTGLRERVTQIFGQVTIQTRTPIGTLVRVWVPASSAFGTDVVDGAKADETAALVDLL
jgi:signal transduction histidine kinase